MAVGHRLGSMAAAISFCLAGGLLRSMPLRSTSFRSTSLRSTTISFCLAGELLRSMPLRSTSLRSTTISFCPSGRPSRGGMRPAPAPRLSGKHNRPPPAGSLSKTLFLTDRTRFAPSSTRPLAASLRLALENAFASAFVMPPQGQKQVQNQKIKA